MASTPSRTLVLTLTAVTDKFDKGLGRADKSLSTFGEKLGNFGKKAALAIAAVGVAAGALAIKVGKDAIGAASDLSEELSKSGELFGTSAGQIDEWAKTAANAFGQSRRQALQAAGNFAIFGRSAGLVGQELVDFSTNFTELASDLASFNNTSPEDAINAIGSALRGEAEPLRRYGILLNDATLKQAAFELGIITTTKDALTPQQKVLAAQKVIYDQVGAAAGDFARTSDGLANSQRILAANIEDVKSTLGEALLPVAEEFSGFLVRVIPDVIELAKEMGEKLGPKIKDVGDFIKNDLLPFAREVWPHIRDFSKWVKELVLGFTEFVREEIAPRFVQLVKDLTEPARDTWHEIKELAASIERLSNAFKSANPEGSIFLDWLFAVDKFKWEFLLERVQNVVRVVTALADAFERVISLGTRAGAFGGAGGDFNLPQGFVPGVQQPQAFSPERRQAAPVTININGAIDSESAAREIRRVLTDSSRRTGYPGFDPSSVFAA
jgi:hypothetical protein